MEGVFGSGKPPGAPIQPLGRQSWRCKLQKGGGFGGGQAISAGTGREFFPVRSPWHGQVDLDTPSPSQRLHQARPERLHERVAAEPGIAMVVMD